jgi:hypothetical protein
LDPSESEPRVREMKTTSCAGRVSEGFPPLSIFEFLPFGGKSNIRQF